MIRSDDKELTPRALPDAKPDAQPDLNPDAQPDAHSDLKPDAKPDTQPDAQPTAQPKAEDLAVPLLLTLCSVLPRVPSPSTITRPRPTGYPATHRLTTKREQDPQRTPNEFTSPEAVALNEQKLEGSAMGEGIYGTPPRTWSSQQDYAAHRFKCLKPTHVTPTMCRS